MKKGARASRRAVARFRKGLTKAEGRLLSRLTTPFAIQTFLDGLAYSTDDFYRCPRRVLRDRVAACFDGGLFAAAALRLIGHKPLIIDMIPNDRDDDHILALFRIQGFWGAVAKSNFAGLRYREPIFKSVRELVLSYFEQYFNVAGEKTLRAYSAPLNLATLDPLDWMESDEHLEDLADRLDSARKYRILTRSQIARLSPVDKRNLEAGLLGSTEAGLFQPD
ncbi:MAG: hypothetical protein ACYTHM_07665 [Planctomycetota bacterium]|jgi:hypothetical protein